MKESFLSRDIDRTCLAEIVYALHFLLEEKRPEEISILSIGCGCGYFEEGMANLYRNIRYYQKFLFDFELEYGFNPMNVLSALKKINIIASDVASPRNKLFYDSVKSKNIIRRKIDAITDAFPGSDIIISSFVLHHLYTAAVQYPVFSLDLHNKGLQNIETVFKKAFRAGAKCVVCREFMLSEGGVLDEVEMSIESPHIKSLIIEYFSYQKRKQFELPLFNYQISDVHQLKLKRIVRDDLLSWLAIVINGRFNKMHERRELHTCLSPKMLAKLCKTQKWKCRQRLFSYKDDAPVYHLLENKKRINVFTITR